LLEKFICRSPSLALYKFGGEEEKIRYLLKMPSKSKVDKVILRLTKNYRFKETVI
jgi:hypothetical protein